MNAEEVLDQLPLGNLSATMVDEAGNELAAGVPIERPEGMPPFDDEPPTVLSLVWDDGSGYMVRWPVDSIRTEGPQTILAGSKGEASISRRN